MTHSGHIPVWDSTTNLPPEQEIVALRAELIARDLLVGLIVEVAPAPEDQLPGYLYFVVP